MVSLKPSEALVAASFSVAAVLAIFDEYTPQMSDVRANEPGDENTRTSTLSAALTSIAVVSGMALLARSPEVYVAGGIVIALEGLNYWRANMTNPDTGKLDLQA